MHKLKLFKNTKPVIAIDGTAGSGKGTLSKNLAQMLKFDHLDTGLLYRIFAYESLKKKDFKKISNALFNEWIEGGRGGKLRTEEISKAASIISQRKDVRKTLIEFQRNFADNPPQGKGSVIDGRDIGTVIIPNAEIKFFLDAQVQIRATRRINQLALDESEYYETLQNMRTRDTNDSERKISPLKRSKDSFNIDTSKINEQEVLDIALNHIKKKLILFNNCISSENFVIVVQ